MAEQERDEGEADPGEDVGAGPAAAQERLPAVTAR